jgi:hypothetical protein
MMSETFDSFQESNVNAFVESDVHARDAVNDDEVIVCPDTIEVVLRGQTEGSLMSADICSECRLLNNNPDYRTARATELKIDGTYQMELRDDRPYGPGPGEECVYLERFDSPTFEWSTYRNVDCTTGQSDFECVNFDFEVRLFLNSDPDPESCQEALDVQRIDIECDNSVIGGVDCMCDIFRVSGECVELGEQQTNIQDCGTGAPGPSKVAAGEDTTGVGRAAVGVGIVNAR